MHKFWNPLFFFIKSRSLNCKFTFNSFERQRHGEEGDVQGDEVRKILHSLVHSLNAQEWGNSTWIECNYLNRFSVSRKLDPRARHGTMGCGCPSWCLDHCTDLPSFPWSLWEPFTIGGFTTVKTSYGASISTVVGVPYCDVLCRITVCLKIHPMKDM